MNRDLGMLLARSTVGLAFASHGAQKAFGSFDGPGPEGAAGFLESLGFKPGKQYAALTSYTELGAGLLLTLGFGGPAAASAVLGVMTVAMASVHAKNGFFAQKGGIELGVLYSAAATAIAMSGYGRYSFDRAFGIDTALRNNTLIWAALVAGPLAGMFALSKREIPPATST